MRTFFRQPLALTGLFFIFMAVMSVISIVPVIGNVLALALLPGFESLGRALAQFLQPLEHGRVTGARNAHKRVMQGTEFKAVLP